jgi:hypothetical protein
MPDHYRLVIETPRANLSQAMGWLQTTYTVRFNRRYGRSGHLFQGRFKAQLVDAEPYGRWLVLYLHLNPVRPRQRQQPVPRERKAEAEAYVWSSHRDYAGRRKSAEWLCRDWLRFWGRTTGEAHERYRQEWAGCFEKPLGNPWEQLRGGLVLGTARLWEKAQRLMGRKSGAEEVRWRERRGRKEAQERIRALVGEEADERVRVWARVRLGGERGKEVAEELGYKDGSGVTQVVKRLEVTAERDKPLAKRLAELRVLSIVKR